MPIEWKTIVRAHFVIVAAIGLCVPSVAGQSDVTVDALFINAGDWSFEDAEVCEQTFIAWCPDCPMAKSRQPYVLIEFKPANKDDCISRREAMSGVVVQVDLRNTPVCNIWGDGLGTWGHAESSCIAQEGWASDCWEERSHFPPLTSEGLSLEQLDDNLYLECFQLLRNPMAKLR